MESKSKQEERKIYTIVIVITFYSTSYLGQKTGTRPFGLRINLPPAILSTTHGGGFSLSLFAERQAGKL